MAINITAAIRVLLQSGLQLHVFDGDIAIFDRADGERFRFQLVERPPAASESSTQTWPSSGVLPLLVVERIGSIRARADDPHFDYVATTDQRCRIAGRVWPAEPELPRRPSHYRCALARVLLSSARPFPQSARTIAAVASQRLSLDKAVGVSQPQISLMLRELPGLCRKEDGWTVADRRILMAWHDDHYPGPGGVRLAWRHKRRYRRTMNRDLPRLVRQGSVAAFGHASKAIILTSGYEAIAEEAGDSPEGLPDRMAEADDQRGAAVVYSNISTTLLEDEGYLRCEPVDSHIQLVRFEDPTIATTASAWGSSFRTDPLITAWELRRGTGHAQAARLRRWANKFAMAR